MTEKKNSKLSRKQNSLNLQLEIKRRPWKNDRRGITQIHKCSCNELNKLIDEKTDNIKFNRTGLSNGKLLPYQDKITIKLNNKNKFTVNPLKKVKLTKSILTGQFTKIFYIQCKFPFSLTARYILLNLTNKYIYYAIDDILYLLGSNPIERDYLLNILYSSMLSLHNDFSINFFDIWIDSIYFNTDIQINRFLQSQENFSNQISEGIITLKLHYLQRKPIRKVESIW